MTYSYSTPLTYGDPQTPLAYDYMNNNRRKPSSVPAAGVGFAAGAIAGGVIGSKINPYFNKSDSAQIKDSFASAAQKKYIKKYGTEAERNFDSQAQKVLKELKGAKNADEVKNLLNNNAEVRNIIDSGLIDSLDDKNIKTNKESIKTAIENTQKSKVETMKNNIVKCWNQTDKKWEKPTGMSDDIYKAIKNTADNMKHNNIWKGIGIGGVGLGLAAFAAHKLYLHNKEARINNK